MPNSFPNDYNCDLARLITSTCRGIGDGMSNPIEISPGTALPRNLLLPVGFIPNQQITDINGQTYPAGVLLTREVIIPAGTTFPFPFTIAPGLSLSNTYTPGSE